jgi:hypothetical protein
MQYHPQASRMKRSLLLLLFCFVAATAQAQTAPVAALDGDALEFARKIILPAIALFLLGSFVLGAIKVVLNYLLKRQILTAGVSESMAERLLPGPQSEQNKAVKWAVLLLSTGTGLAVCRFYLPLGLHSVIILLFSTAFGFLTYYLFLRRQAK